MLISLVLKNTQTPKLFFLLKYGEKKKSYLKRKRKLLVYFTKIQWR
jgi:hypothetical protein